MSLVVPAVLPASRQALDDALALFASVPTVSRIQIDVVDGRFATPASWPYNTPQEFESTTLDQKKILPYLDRLTYEIDLMCLDAEVAARLWLTLGASRLTFHAESTSNLPRLFAAAREDYGEGAHFAPGLIAFGLAINIASDLTLVEQNLSKIEYVQFMGIARIGQQGQPFDERVFEKVRIFHTRHPDIEIQVDGGVSLDSAKKLLALGVSRLVVGSALTRSGDPAAEIEKFEGLQSSFGV